MATHEEVFGLMQGIAAVVRDQQTANKDITNQTQQQIQEHSHAVIELSKSVHSKETSFRTLRLLQLSITRIQGWRTRGYIY